GPGCCETPSGCRQIGVLGYRQGLYTKMSKVNRSVLLLLVLSGTIISICMGLRQSLGLFMRPMAIDTGITAATFGFSIALQNIVWGIAQPFAGGLADKYGPRPVLIVTAISYALGLVLMAYSHGELGLDIAGFLLGIGTAGCAFGVLIGVVTRATPEERRSQTVGIVAAAGSLGTMLLAPLGQSLISAYGWHVALLCFAGIASSMAVLAFPVRSIAISLNADPSVHRNSNAKVNSNAQPLSEALREAIGHRGYVFMTLA